MKPTDPPSHKAAAGQVHGGAAHGHHRHSPEELHNEGVAHEHSDINVRAIVGFLFGLAALTAVVCVLMGGLFKVFEWQAASNDPSLSPLAAPPPQMPTRTAGSPFFGGAPHPQLLVSEPLLLKEVRQSEANQLDEYGWVDEKAGVARVPIAEAKKLILERGLPVRAGAPVDPGLGTVKASRGEATGGRILTAGVREQNAPAVPSRTEVAPPPTSKH